MRFALVFSLLFAAPYGYAAWSTTSPGYLEFIQTYPNEGGLRVVVRPQTLTHSCGTHPTVFYYDASKIPVEVVQMVASVALTAKTAGKRVTLTFDCGLAGGGFGWGVGMAIVE